MSDSGALLCVWSGLELHLYWRLVDGIVTEIELGQFLNTGQQWFASCKRSLVAAMRNLTNGAS